MIEQRAPYWSFSGQVCFVDGFAYGLLPNLRTVRIGTEEAVNKILKDGGDPVPSPRPIIRATTSPLQPRKGVTGRLGIK